MDGWSERPDEDPSRALRASRNYANELIPGRIACMRLVVESRYTSQTWVVPHHTFAAVAANYGHFDADLLIALVTL